MDIIQQIKGIQFKPNDVLVVKPSAENWDALLDLRALFLQSNVTLLLLDRFSSDVAIISESEMNNWGWVKNE